MKIRIFTDGACSGNPGCGGWASVFNSSETCTTISGFETMTTNNKMELRAVVESLKKILSMHNASEIEFELYSDSAYVVNAINNGWIERWQMCGWKTSKKEDVKNRDLWEKFVSSRKLMRSLGIRLEIFKIKGHAGNTFNEMVDQLAKEEVMRAKEAMGI